MSYSGAPLSVPRRLERNSLSASRSRPIVDSVDRLHTEAEEAHGNHRQERSILGGEAEVLDISSS
jgi:hypothetical protein